MQGRNMYFRMVRRVLLAFFVSLFSTTGIAVENRIDGPSRVASLKPRILVLTDIAAVRLLVQRGLPARADDAWQHRRRIASEATE